MLYAKFLYARYLHALSCSATLASAVASLLLAAPTHAAEDPLPKWELGLGVAAARLADYRGASHGHTYALPIPYGIYRGDRLRLDREQNRFRIFSAATFSVDWSAALTQPVKSEDSPRRVGMEDLEPALEWGPQLKFALNEHWALQTRMHVISTIEDNKLHDRGYTVTPSLSWQTELPHDFSLGMRLGAPFSSQRTHDYYYGVAPAYATTDRPGYDADGGFAGINSQITVSRRTRHAWYGVFLANHFMEHSAIEDSPLIDDKTSWSAGIGATWLLFQSSERAGLKEPGEKD